MMRRLIWNLRRELWENRWLWVAPASIAAVLFTGFVAYALGSLPAQVAGVAAVLTAHSGNHLREPYEVVSGVMMGIGLLVAVIYCVDALYGERRDRSVLLWKSLPVSDPETVLAKLCIPTIVLPAIVWGLTVVLQLGMLLASTAVLAAHGQSATMVWSSSRVFADAGPLLYHLVALHGIATSPIYAWILLVSAWAPRAPLAWAILPPVAIGVLERVALGTTRFAALVLGPLGGGGATSTAAAPGNGGMMRLMSPTLGQLLVAPGFWAGLAVAGLFVLGAARLRRSAQPA
ncbi:MAG: ABC transporter permease [Gemmatimonadaceae bacterium]|nr:ABC transporter permease [Gemmatimonadaceae bacterium]